MTERLIKAMFEVDPRKAPVARFYKGLAWAVKNCGLGVELTVPVTDEQKLLPFASSNPNVRVRIPEDVVKKILESGDVQQEVAKIVRRGGVKRGLGEIGAEVVCLGLAKILAEDEDTKLDFQI
ncbi:hypothetical protein ACFL1Q_01050 [Patescibacteria group bacterium]